MVTKSRVADVSHSISEGHYGVNTTRLFLPTNRQMALHETLHTQHATMVLFNLLQLITTMWPYEVVVWEGKKAPTPELLVDNPDTLNANRYFSNTHL
jgi:hypothetical protein